ncbi:hypothetical protein JQX09_17245 [Sulfitobacter pseudonitzschiae]|uniref:Uncharacterized protein n=1 Tax=Pseudosulfitobacter pseudonitzschiae TaxID=1402135 RepID=A0A9Q2NRD7_9RHOB|nr:hypothetical protein [Pseudosulfitobacter pseudonitzschiae]MBM2292877.1 hypothetical protein [Pseudosulfitobacter pseudonitzschiae]MBM2298595.1 hypothetical protein [Pseudosulfitobacter pseudonitzschiae]MBM2303509.1 hypothetical protein [Pseudosulfitobacter pseudonitzschiae]MBM2313292.1 hypothetical protein [Pseudosulfitobacter pseudonitzschiae]MBM2318205.1 hypothetical protein [Pseudosulfitobacter pseudonitzschiae]
MINITPDEDAAQIQQALGTVYRELGELREQLAALKEEARDRGDADAKDVRATVASLRSSLETCMKLETQVAECRRKQSHIAQGGYALDLDAARAEVGCRLARLRECGGTGEVLS